MNQRTQHLVTVTNTEVISPAIRRITLKSDDANHFTPDCEGKYFKFLFSKQGDTDLSTLAEDERPVLRTYTIRDFDPANTTLTVDFVRHLADDPSCGFAARWAEKTQVGDTIKIIGPGGSEYPAFDRTWNFFVADMTALPALSVVLKKLPADAQGYAVIEVAEAADIQTLTCPAGVKQIWVDRSQGESLSETVQSQVWRDGEVDVWCACEFDSMRALRRYFRNERAIDKDHIYISSYWKDGVTEEGHKVIKREDMASAG